MAFDFNCRRLPRRRQRIWIFIATALVVVFVLQIAVYCAINNAQLYLQDCGSNCPNQQLPFSTRSIRSSGRNKQNVAKQFEIRQYRQSSKDSISDTKSMLIVGGSDGSGTRAIVEILRGLGTIVVSEDLGTFDVNAEDIFHSSLDGHVSRGWPSLVERFASNFCRDGLFPSSVDHQNNTVSVNYCWPPPLEALKIEMDVANGIKSDVTKLLIHWNDMYENIIKSQASKSQASTKSITYAIKAPASMLVLPVFAHLFQHQRKGESQPKQRLKFLHVIRDGRDVALSDNQSPVIKFYNLTYPPKHPRRQSLSSFVSSSVGLGESVGENSVTHAKAMQLWNDWNINTYRWANDPKHSGIDIDYMWVRSEDLLVPGSPERLDALTALARFVGSTMTQAELCVLSRQGTIDYGESMRSISRSILHNNAGGNEIDILSRWKSQNRDAEKRKKQQQQLGRRRLQERQISEFSVAKDEPLSSVQNRYGKWKSLLENKPRIRDFFYEEGGEGLSLFGYHPHRNIYYTNVDLSSTLCGS